MSKIARYRGIEIVVRTRDEHCEPHVHVYHLGQDWELRVFFSYVSDQIMDIELLHGHTPKQGVVQAIMDKVIDHLDKARELFWQAVGTVCLENQYILVVNGVAQAARQETTDAMRVTAARYIASTQSIEFEVHGTTTRQTAKCP